MKKRIVKQVGMCLLIIIALAIGKVSGADILETGTDVILNQMSEDYSGEDIAQIAKGGARAVSSIPDKVDDAIVFVTGKQLYGDPIEKYSGDRASVFAVGNGQVTAAGENETIGKYVKITHGSDGESLYGNLDEVFAKVPSNVKKGQIIGTYRESAGKDFYYSFTEFD
ncbi:MAG TPA: M23 family metallopeptidase [Candidatus Copromorpha excrementavium]|uniref:M23 family metallopeptidase n=1 Tax=Candidatus Allocopromorpha excrementavium TaxID=2840741 RepID=A0A9D1KUY1_9FIRM|nr:M23 family metallopeptidase [Candidatus Copromorpha excrementavium]